MSRSIDRYIHSTLRTVSEFVCDLCEVVDTPRAMTVYMLVKAKEWHQLVELEINPEDYLEPMRFAVDYQVTVAMQKFDGLPLGIDRDKAAYETFLEGEERCKQTNLEFLFRADHDLPP